MILSIKSIITILMSMCLFGCAPSAVVERATATSAPNQGFIGHVYAYYTGPAPLCDSGVCATNIPMREPMPNVHVVVVDVDMKVTFAETVSREDGSYKVNVPTGTYRVCLKFETGMTCNNVDKVSANTYIVEDFDVGQG